MCFSPSVKPRWVGRNVGNGNEVAFIAVDNFMTTVGQAMIAWLVCRRQRMYKQGCFLFVPVKMGGLSRFLHNLHYPKNPLTPPDRIGMKVPIPSLGP